MSKVINTKLTKDNLVIEIPKEWLVEQFNEVYEGDYKVKYKNKFLQELSEQLGENMETEDIIADVYDYLCSSDNVKCLEDED